MDLFTEDDLRELISVHYENCVSLYMPSFRTGSETQQNPIRFKNLIDNAEESLISRGIRASDASIFMAPVRRILQNPTFWTHQAEGLAAFIAPGTMKTFRLPASFSEISFVGPSFYLKPLLALLTGNSHFYLLELQSRSVRFFEGSRVSLSRYESDKIPTSLDDTLGFDTQEKQTQFASKPSWNDARNTTIFGYGRQTDKWKVNVLNYYHRVDDAISELLQNSHDPLILAGVDYLHALYKEANSYPYLHNQHLCLDIQNFTESEIHQKIWPLLEPHFREKQKIDADYYRQLKGEMNRLAANDLKTIVAGSLHGRIGILFLTDGQADYWGKFVESRQDIEIHATKLPGDEDLLDKAAINTIIRGGTVYFLERDEMPDSTAAAAILRY
ncbi:MAG: hypothetical protein GX640_17445 [Fibrobacter sp.]|nr:hypothetical protein [Fibrobacter sp.]